MKEHNNPHNRFAVAVMKGKLTVEIASPVISLCSTRDNNHSNRKSKRVGWG